MNTTSMPLPQSAEDWLARLLSPHCSDRDRADFEDWLAASPQNAANYVETERMHQMVRELAADPALFEAARAARRDTSGARWSSRLPGWRSMAAAASLLLVGATGYWMMHGRAVEETRFATQIGEQSKVDLPDGSELVLDTDSQVTSSFGDKLRSLELQRGRLQVQVAHDAARPFVVRAGQGTIRATGTAFQVQRLDQKTLVGLLEGEVVVTASGGASAQARTLRPGQQLSYDDSGRISSPAPLDAEVARAWAQGSLVFKNRRLDELLADMNRYSTTQFVLADPELANITISGVFHAGDQQALLDTLQKGWPVRAQRTGENEITLSPRRE